MCQVLSFTFNLLHAGYLYIHFVCFLSPTYMYKTFSKLSFINTIRMSNSLNPYQARRFVGPDMAQTVCKV